MVWRTNFDKYTFDYGQAEAHCQMKNGKTNIDSLGPGQQMFKQSSSSSSSSSSIGSNGSGLSKPSTNQMVQGATTSSSAFISAGQREQQVSPITIPLNESMTIQGIDDNNIRELDPTTAAIFQATQTQSLRTASSQLKSANQIGRSANVKKPLLVQTNIANGNSANVQNSILKKVSSSASANANDPTLTSNISFMFEQLVQQMETLTQVI